MANWCINYIRIDGKEKDIEKLYAILDLPNLGPKTIDFDVVKQQVSGYVSDEKLNAFIKKFEKTSPEFVPLGKEYGLLEDYECLSYPDIKGYSGLDLNFSTKWSPIFGFWLAISELTETQIVLEFDEPGNEYKGRWVARSGKVIDDYILERLYEVRATHQELNAYPIPVSQY